MRICQAGESTVLRRGMRTVEPAAAVQIARFAGGRIGVVLSNQRVDRGTRLDESLMRNSSRAIAYVQDKE